MAEDIVSGFLSGYQGTQDFKQQREAAQTLKDLANDPEYQGKPVSVIQQQAGERMLKSGSARLGLELLNQSTLSQDREMRAAENRVQTQDRSLDMAGKSLDVVLSLPKDQQVTAGIEAVREYKKTAPAEMQPALDKMMMALSSATPDQANAMLTRVRKDLKSQKTALAEQGLELKALQIQREERRDAETQRHHTVIEAQGQQKIDRKDMKYPDITGDTTTTPSGAVIGGAGGIGTDLSESIQNKISSGIRTNDKLYEESVKAGRPGKTAEGRPIAKPGTSKHEPGKEGALDIPPKALSKEDRKELAEKGYYQPYGTDSVHWEKLPGAKAATTPATTTEAAPATPAAATTSPTAQGEKILENKDNVNKIVSFINKDVKTSTQRADTGTVKSTLREIRPSEWAALDTPQAIKTVSGGLDAARQAKKISNFVKDNNVSTGAVGELVKKLDKYNPMATPEEAMKNLGEKEQILGKLVLDFANAYARSERGGATPMATVAELKAAINTFGTGAMSPASTISAFNYIAENKLNKLAETYFGGDRSAILLPKQTEAAAAPKGLPVNMLKEGQNTTFGNGQVWTLKNGQPVQVK